MIFRFINAIINSRLDEKEIWGQIKTLRFEYLQESINFKKCERDLIPWYDIEPNLEKLSNILGVNSSEKINSNVSESDINVAAEMFFGLNSCPSIYEKLYWKAIYGTNSSVETAMLASNIIKISTGDFKRSSLQIFAKISQVLGFKHILFHDKELYTSESKNTLMIKKQLDTTGERKSLKRVEWDSQSLNCLALKSIQMCITCSVLLGQWLFLVYLPVLLRKYTFLLG